MEATTRDLLLRPDTYFKDLMKRGESLKIPLIIILVGGILGAFNAYQVSGLTGQMFSQAMSGMGGIVTIMGALAGFVMFFLLWVIYSGIVFAISMAFKGTGSFKRTLEVMGLGMIPQVFGAAVTLLLSFYYLPLVEVPRVTSLQDPAVVQAAVQQLMNDPAMCQLTLPACTEPFTPARHPDGGDPGSCIHHLRGCDADHRCSRNGGFVNENTYFICTGCAAFLCVAHKPGVCPNRP
jgi:hypothetical protein